MIGMVKTRKLRYVSVDNLPLRSLVLALFLVFGILLGHFFACGYGLETAQELQRYLDECLSVNAWNNPTPGIVVQTVFCFLRSTLLAFLFGFASIGVVALPLLFTAQGFVVSFSLAAYALALGHDSFALLPALFAIRLIFVLPATFLMGTAAIEKAQELAMLSLGGGRRSAPVIYGVAYFYRFAVCCICLLLGSALELWIVPLLLARF